MAEFLDEMTDATRPVEEALDADIICYSGGIYPPSDETIISISEIKRRPNVLLILTTRGGSPDTAYRIARCLQQTYEGGKFIIYVHWNCKSAGTLITLACDELIMAPTAHLGPLDIQMASREEIGESSSGLTPGQALSTLAAESWRLFETHFSELRFKLRLSTKMAADVAATITTGVFGKIYEQMDPFRLGENDRAMKISEHYGKRLIKQDTDTNVKLGTLDRLIAGYPSHSFVIDRTEAMQLFNRIRLPTDKELALADLLRFIMLTGRRDEDADKPASVYSISRIAKDRSESKIEAKKSDDSKPKENH